MKISISKGNSKMGAIPSVSLPPVKTCAAGVPCASKCYAAKMCKLRPSVRDAYERNLQELLENPESYWAQVRGAAAGSRFFRFHVSGDILDVMYLYDMALTARMLPHTTFLAFTKRYDIVNDFIAGGCDIPENLKIIFSEWGDCWDVPNPYNLPTAAVIFKGAEIPEHWKICGGNCYACACRGVGCWELKSGETIAFYEH